MTVLTAAVSPSASAVPVVAALAIAVVLDLAVGEPPTRLHPVAWFGSLVEFVDRSWARPRLVGVAVAVGLPLGAAALAGGIVRITAGYGPVPRGIPVLGVLVAGVVLFSVVSLRMLLDVTAEVVALTGSDPDAARESIRALVGRDAADLSPAALRSAAVESAAENLADGFVAPLVGFTLGAAVGLAIGGVGTAVSNGIAVAVWVKAVNTLDSMLGYRSNPIGWASAKLDDAVMLVPARVTAVCLALAARSPGTLPRARACAREPSSPNSGWPMATAAAALDVRLEKAGHYVLNPDAGAPSVADARDAVRLVGVAGGVAVALAAGALLVTGWLLGTVGVFGWL